MAILRIKNIPKNTAIAVFGMTENQWSVNGDPDNVYYSDRSNVTELIKGDGFIKFIILR